MIDDNITHREVDSLLWSLARQLKWHRCQWLSADGDLNDHDVLAWADLRRAGIAGTIRRVLALEKQLVCDPRTEATIAAVEIEGQLRCEPTGTHLVWSICIEIAFQHRELLAGLDQDSDPDDIDDAAAAVQESLSQIDAAESSRLGARAQRELTLLDSNDPPEQLQDADIEIIMSRPRKEPRITDEEVLNRVRRAIAAIGSPNPTIDAVMAKLKDQSENGRAFRRNRVTAAMKVVGEEPR